MKHLKVKYTTDSGNSIVLFDGEVNEVVWSDGPNGIRVEGKTAASGGGLNLLEMLTGASKAKTESVIEDKKSAIEAEKTPVQDNSIDVIQAAQS